MVIWFSSSLAGFCPGERVFYIEKSNSIIYISWNDIDGYLKKHKVRYPQIAKAQIRLETGHLKSVICKENKNLFGMRYAPQRATTAIGELNNHALYVNYEKSIEDYKLWQDLYYHKGEDYYLFLLRVGYAQDQKYITKLKSVLK